MNNSPLPPSKSTDDAIALVANVLVVLADPKKAQEAIKALKGAADEHRAAREGAARERAEYIQYRQTTERDWQEQVAKKTSQLDAREDALHKHVAQTESELAGRERRIAELEGKAATAAAEAEKLRDEARRRLAAMEGR
jgi:Sec-independent protein translocase protein TatA